MKTGTKQERHGHASNGILSSEYMIWRGIVQRCEDKNCCIYKYYGGRGIKICNKWRKSFLAFLRDMGNRPSAKHQIDRIDNNGNYSPDNCRWATKKQNARNTRANKFITVNGQTKCLQEWAEILGCKHSTILKRIKLGWSEHDSVTIPIRNLQNSEK